MIARNVRVIPRLMCLALVGLLMLIAAPLLMAESTPVAVMMPDELTVQVGEEVAFTGEDSYYSHGNITMYLWDMGDGTRLNGMTISHAFTAPGVYTVTLVVMADDGTHGTDTGTMTVDNRTSQGSWTASIDSASTERSTYGPGETVTAKYVVERGPDVLTAVWEGVLVLEVLDGATTTVHNDNEIVWIATGGDQQTIEFEFVLTGAGDYVLRASLYWRNETLVDEEELDITVDRDYWNKAPIAIIDPSSQVVEVGEEATFDGGSSYDPDNDATTYEWELGDGSTVQGTKVAHAYDAPGRYNVTLIVTDEHDATGKAYALVEVVARDKPPGDVAVWVSSLETGKASYEVGETMDASAVVTRGPDLLTFVWEGTLLLQLLDPEGLEVGSWDMTVYLPVGGRTQTFSLTVEPAQAGPHILVATLYWMDGAFVDERKLNVTVTGQDRNQPPVAVIDPANQTLLISDLALLDGSSSYDDDGSIESYVWDLGDGTTADGAKVAHVYRLPGLYRVTLTVTDDDGAVSTVNGAVKVNDVAPPPIDEEAWIVSVGTNGVVNESEPFLVTVKVMRGDDMLDYLWLGTIVLELIDNDAVLNMSEDIGLATGGEARSFQFELVLIQPGDFVLRATLYRRNGTQVDVEEASLTVVGVTGPDVPRERALPNVPVPAVAAAGLLVLLAALGATEVGKTSLLGLLVPLYTKLKKDQILDQFIRGKIYGYILANPGDHYNAIQKALDIPNGTFAYHLQVLEKEGFIKSTREGMNRCFFPAGVKIPSRGRTLRAGQRLVVETILEDPGISQKDIASAIGVSPSTVNYHLKDLLEMGVVETERWGMRLKYYINRDLIRTSV